MPARNIRRTLLISAVLLLLAAVFWALYLPRAENSVFGRVPYLDEIIYLDRAAAVRTGEDAATPHFMAPLYPRLIAATGAGTPDADSGVYPPSALRPLRLLQITCWFGTLLLLVAGGHLLARDVTGGRLRTLAAWLPAGLYFLYRPAAIFAVSVLAETVLTFVVTFAVYLALRVVGGAVRSSRLVLAHAALAGAALGAAVLLRGTALMLVPALAWAFWRGARRDSEGPVRGPRAAAVLVAVCVLAVLPAAVHNSRLAGRPAGPTLNAGVNLYIGNGPAANGFYVQVIPGDLRDDPAGTGLQSVRVGHPVSVAEADRLWRQAAAAAVRSDPWRAIGLGLKKAWLQLQNWEIEQIAGQGAWRAEVPVLNILVVPYGLLTVLGLVGLVAGWRRRPLRLLAVALLLLVAGQSLFFVVARYRQVLVPLWALAAGTGVVALARRPRLAAPVLIAAVLVVIPWGQGDVRQQTGGLAWANAAQRWGVVAAHDGDEAAYARAEQLYRRALDQYAGAYEPWLGLATVLDGQGRADEAIAVLAEGVQAADRPAELEHALIAMLIRKGRRGEALARVDAALARTPADPTLLHNASYLLAESGDLAGAEQRALELIAHHPADPRGYADLGVLKARQGELAAARSAFEAGLRMVPDDPGLLRNLQRLDAPAGR